MKQIAIFVFSIFLLLMTNVRAEEYKITLNSKKCISEIILTVFLPPDWEVKEIYPEQYSRDGEITFIAPPELVAGYEFSITAFDETGREFPFIGDNFHETAELISQ